MALVFDSAHADAYASLNEAVSSSDETRTYSIEQDLEIGSADLGALNGTSLTIEGNHHAVTGKSGRRAINVAAGKTLVVRNVGSFAIEETPGQDVPAVTVSKAWGNFAGTSYNARNVGGLALNAGTVSIHDSAFGPNVNNNRAAVVYNLATIDAFENSVAYDTTTGVFVNSKENAVIHTISNSYFLRNYYSEWGAVLNNEDGALVDTITASYFVGNVGNKKSSVINNINGAEITLIENSVFKDNVVLEPLNNKGGGGIYNESGVIGDIVNTDFIGNLVVSTAEDNVNGRGRGAAIFSHKNGSSVTITDSRFIGNATFSGGAALWNSDFAVMNIRAIDADTVFSGNLAYASFEEIVSGKSYSVVSGTPNDIHNTATLNLDAAAGRSILLGGGVSGDDPNGSKGVIHINNNLAGATGTIVFGGILEKNRVNLYAGTLKLNADDLADTSILNLVGGTLDLANGQAGAMNIVRIDGSGANLKIDLDLDGNAADRIATANASTGTLTLTGINLIAQDPPAILNQTKTFRVVDTQNANLRLADGLETDGQGKHRFRDFVDHVEPDIAASVSWNDDYNVYDITKDILGTVEVFTGTTTNDSIRVTVTDLIEVSRITTPRDALALLNSFATASGRTFAANSANQTHTLSADLGATAAGRLEVAGVAEAEQRSTLDLNGRAGFALENATDLAFTDIRVTGASSDVVTVGNGEASLTLSNAVIEGGITGSTAFAVNASGDNTITGEIAKADILNAGTLRLAGAAFSGSLSGAGTTIVEADLALDDAASVLQALTVLAGRTLEANASSLTAEVSNAGTLKLTGGTLAQSAIAGTGATRIAGDVVLASDASLSQSVLELASGKLDLTNLTGASGEIDFTANASPVQVGTIRAQGARLDFQDGKTGTLALGAIDVSASDLLLGVDLDFAHGKADVLSGTFVAAGSNGIVIDSLNLLADEAESFAADIQLAEASLDGQRLSLVDTSVTSPALGDLLLTLAVNAQGTFIHVEHADLRSAISSSASDKVFTVTAPTTLTNGSGALTLAGRSLSIDGASNSPAGIVAQSADFNGIELGSSQNLHLENLTVTGFKAVVANNGGTVHLENVTASGNTEADVANDGELVLDGENSLSKVTGTGSTVVASGSTFLSAELTQSELRVGSAAAQTDAVLVNEGEIAVTNLYVETALSRLDNDGTVDASVTNAGTIVNNGTITGSVTNLAGARLETRADSAATGQGEAIVNEGELSLTGGTLAASVSGDGLTTIAGDVEVASQAKIAQNMEVLSGKSLRADAAALEGAVSNAGVLKLTGGTLAREVTGLGSTLVEGDVALADQGSLRQKVNVAEEGRLSANASGLYADVADAGELVLTGGTFSRNATGSGLTRIAGEVLNSGSIATAIRVDSGSLTSNMANLAGDITLAENTVLKLTGRDFDNRVEGSGEVRFLEEAIWRDAVVSTGTSVSIEDQASLDVGGKALTLDALTVKGTLKVSITGLASDSSEYEGGHITVSRLELGESARLLIKVSSNLLEEGSGKTAGLVLIDTDGEPASESFAQEALAINDPYKVTVNEDGTYSISLVKSSVPSGFPGFGGGFTGGSGGSPQSGDAGETGQGSGTTGSEQTGDTWNRTDLPEGSLAGRLQDALIVLSSTDRDAYLEVLRNLAPSTSSASAALAAGSVGKIGRQVGKRLSPSAGGFAGSFGGGGLPFDGHMSARSSGALLKPSRGLWASTLYGHAKDPGSAAFSGFTMRSAGVMLGADADFTDEIVLGAGYSFEKSRMHSDGTRHSDAHTHNVFVYGQYEVDGLFVKATAGLGFTDYDDHSLVLGVDNRAKHDATSLHASLGAGVRMDNGLKFESGLRWIRLGGDTYTDTFGQTVRTRAAQTSTATASAEFAKSFEVAGGQIGFSAFASASYDIHSDASRSLVTIGNASYVVDGKKMKAFGVDAGAGVSYRTDNWYFSLEYVAGKRGDYRNRSGMLTVRRTF